MASRTRGRTEVPVGPEPESPPGHGRGNGGMDERRELARPVVAPGVTAAVRVVRLARMHEDLGAARAREHDLFERTQERRPRHPPRLLETHRTHWSPEALAIRAPGETAGQPPQRRP